MSDTVQEIERRRLAEAERPLGFNRTTGEMSPISEAFETFLIAATDSVKKELTQFLESNASEDSNRKKLKSKLAGEFYDSRIKEQSRLVDIAKSSVDEVNAQIAKILAVSVADSEQLTSEERSNLIADLRTPILELEEQSRIAEYQKVLLDFCKTIDTLEDQNVATVQRIRSWSTSLLGYPEG